MTRSARISLALDAQCRLAGLPVPVSEYKFHPTRRWRFDFCFPGKSIAVEIDGGLWIRGRHSRPVGQEQDMTKQNEAAILGWTVLRFSPAMVSDGRALAVLERVLR